MIYQMGNNQSDESSWLSWFIKKPAQLKRVEKQALKIKPQPSSDDESTDTSSSDSSDLYIRGGNGYKRGRFDNACC